MQLAVLVRIHWGFITILSRVFSDQTSFWHRRLRWQNDMHHTVVHMIKVNGLLHNKITLCDCFYHKQCFILSLTYHKRQQKSLTGYMSIFIRDVLKVNSYLNVYMHKKGCNLTYENQKSSYLNETCLQQATSHSSCLFIRVINEMLNYVLFLTEE